MRKFYGHAVDIWTIPWRCCVALKRDKTQVSQPLLSSDAVLESGDNVLATAFYCKALQLNLAI